MSKTSKKNVTPLKERFLYSLIKFTHFTHRYKKASGINGFKKTKKMKGQKFMNLKGTVYWAIFESAWNFFKAYAEVKDTEEFWDSLVKEYGELCKKYEGKEFSKNMMMAVFTEIERIGKNGAHEKLE